MVGDPPPTSGTRSEDFERARHETLRYHKELYATTSVGQAGTWLADPNPLLLDALERIPAGRAVTAYDLGAGIGRHTYPMLRRLPSGSEVYAVDLLQSALDELDSGAPPGNAVTLHTVQADLAEFTCRAPADLVIAFSAIEHLSGEEPIRALLGRIHAAVNPGGVVALGIVADRFEVRSDGTRRAALLESDLSAATARGMLARVFDDFTIAYSRSSRTEVDEERDGEHYTLHSTLVTFLASRGRRT